MGLVGSSKSMPLVPLAPSTTSGFYTPEEVQQMDEPAPVADPVTITQAVAEAAAFPSQEEIEKLIDAMDVATLPSLQSAFEAAWRATKDPALRLRFKGIYDAQKADILQAQQRDANEAAQEVPL